MRPSSKQTIARPFSSSLAGAHEILPPPPPPRGAKHGRVLFSSPLLFSPSKSSKVAANRVRESTREERSMFRIATESSSNRGRERERERGGVSFLVLKTTSGGGGGRVGDVFSSNDNFLFTSGKREEEEEDKKKNTLTTKRRATFEREKMYRRAKNLRREHV